MVKKEATDQLNASKSLNEIPTGIIKDFLENGTVGLHIARSDGIIVWANKADYECIGYTADDYIGISMNNYYFIY